MLAAPGGCRAAALRFTARYASQVHVSDAMCVTHSARPCSLTVCRQGRVFVVGDPDQAIYSWRGADPSKMSHSFLADFPGALSGARVCILATWHQPLWRLTGFCRTHRLGKSTNTVRLLTLPLASARQLLFDSWCQ